MFWNLFTESLVEHGQDILKWFDSHNGLIQAIATVVLVLITIRSIKEAEDTRKDNRLPIIKLIIGGPINYRGKNQYISLIAENIGYGLALDVKLNFTFAPIEQVEFGNIETGDKKGFTLNITEEGLEQMKIATKIFDVITISYKDVFDRTLTTFASIKDENMGTNHDWPVIVVSKWHVNLPE
ncbi:MAG: hypothetical protein WCG02_02825 [Candidatus Taylorbacteria bacterium]